jgi:hypothetical protein
LSCKEQRFCRREGDRKRSLNTHYLFISVNAKSVFSSDHSGRSSDHPAPLHRQATIRIVVCRPQRSEATHLITGPSRSSSTPLESPQRRELSRLFETDPSQKQLGFSSETQRNIRSKASKLAVRSRACLALGFAPGLCRFRLFGRWELGKVATPGPRGQTVANISHSWPG